MKIGLTLSILSLTLVSSCAWYKDLEKSLVEDDIRQSQKKQVVPRQKYEELLVKYEELSKKYEALTSSETKSSLVEEIQATKPQTSSETIDLFGSPTVIETTRPEIELTNAPIVVPKGMEDQVSLYRRGVILRQTNPGEATKVFQQLELQGSPAIQVRAKQQIGEMLFEKGQYDLALQVFEDIISNFSHSGVVLEALKFSVICADKLGIVNKKEQYASILNDVFESR